MTSYWKVFKHGSFGHVFLIVFLFGSYEEVALRLKSRSFSRIVEFLESTTEALENYILTFHTKMAHFPVVCSDSPTQIPETTPDDEASFKDTSHSFTSLLFGEPRWSFTQLITGSVMEV